MRLIAFLCAALSYPKKALESGWLPPFVMNHTPSQPGGWFHDHVDEWVENVRDHTRLWSCFLAFIVLVEFAVICAIIFLALMI